VNSALGCAVARLSLALRAICGIGGWLPGSFSHDLLLWAGIDTDVTV
jgi:hypothetical protein